MAKKDRSTLTTKWCRKDKRLALYLRDGMRCVFCNTDLTDSPDQRSLDHLVCRSKGGSNDPRNLATSCISCNCARQDRPLAQFASPEARRTIRRVTRRKLAPYRKQAKAMLTVTVTVSVSVSVIAPA